ncbi:lipopolysaccharide heptosyltransferase family protein [Candidatus Pelagibacter sp.]|nr:lipopolysaccharide heptosyltransferase family protein [Candidatus Pelagibacter sp.]
MIEKICITYSHHKLGDLIWQLPYIKAISEHHNKKIDLVVREKTQAKEILKDLNYINTIHYNNFRKKIFYWIDVFKLKKIFFTENYTHVYILDKINKPAVAAKLANIKNIIGPGIKRQKKWLTSKNFLDDKDWLLSYSEQSQKLLKLNNIKIKDIYPHIEVNSSNIEKFKKNFFYSGKKIAFGVDSFEDYKIWYEENFIELANKFYDKKVFDYIYLVCGKDKQHIAKDIIAKSNKNYFIDCSDLKLIDIISVIKDSDFFVGNNSGPLNLAAALNIKSFGLFANTAISQLKFSKVIPLVPENYVDNQFIKDREEMRKLTPDKVFLDITKNLND